MNLEVFMWWGIWRQNVMDKFEEAWKENRHVWESSKNLAKAMYLAGQQSRQAEVEEKDKRIESQSNCIENLVVRKSDYLDKVTKAIAHLDSFDHSKASINKLQRSIECALEALRGEHE